MLSNHLLYRHDPPSWNKEDSPQIPSQQRTKNRFLSIPLHPHQILVLKHLIKHLYLPWLWMQPQLNIVWLNLEGQAPAAPRDHRWQTTIHHPHTDIQIQLKRTRCTIQDFADECVTIILGLPGQYEFHRAALAMQGVANLALSARRCSTLEGISLLLGGQ